MNSHFLLINTRLIVSCVATINGSQTTSSGSASSTSTSQGDELVGPTTSSVSYVSGSNGYASLPQPALMPATKLSSTSCNANRIPYAHSKRGRGLSNGRCIISTKRGNGSQIPNTSVKRPILRPTSGGSSIGREANTSSQARNVYTVAYCYQSTYYAWKANSNSPEVIVCYKF